MLSAFIKTHQPPLEKALQNFFATKKKAAQVLSPTLVHSIEVLEDFVLQGGKRIRPMLVLLGFQLAGGKISGDSDPIYQVAAAVELVHKYLLLLDDIADRDELRNGQPTVWQRYQTEFTRNNWHEATHHGRTFAEIDSALLASFVTELITSLRTSTLSADKLLEVLDLIDLHQYFETVAGWQIQYQMNHLPLEKATEAEFIKGLELVTARYTFVGPLLIGASLGPNHTSILAKILTNYGIAVGTAFQLQDDILGLYGDPAETGKPVGNDVREGKKTLLLQHAFQKAEMKDREFLAKVCGSDLSTLELKQVQEVVKMTGSLADSQALANQFVNEGIAALNVLDQKNDQVKILIDLANFVVNRKV